MKFIFIVISLVFSQLACGDIPDWYRRDIVSIIEASEAVIVYKVKNVSLYSTFGTYQTYRIETETLHVLKGNPPKGECYLFQTEGKINNTVHVGEEGILILRESYTGECGEMESGYEAPFTVEYFSLFKSIIKKVI